MTKITTFGPIDKRSLEQLKRCAEGRADYAVLCADHHVGYSQPIGAAIAYENHISPSGVGYDIGCGNKAVKTNIKVQDIDISRVMDEIFDEISFGVGRKNKDPVDHPVLDSIRKAEFEPQRKLLKRAREQLGTVGSGNHYVDMFKDEDDWVWIGIHFGSRGFGHKTASGFLSLAQGKKFDQRVSEGEMHSPPVLFEIDSPLGQDYIAAMELGGEYAYAGRDVVCNEILKILGAKSVEEVHNNHNFAWHEEHFGKKYWVVRKGCTPAWPGQRCFVGSTMGDISVILEGVDSEKSKESLYTTIHGAGRIMSRRQAAGKTRWKKIHGERKKVVVKPGKVDFEAVKDDLQEKGIELRGGGPDEAPEVYKRLEKVLKYHEGTVKILHRLTPLGVAMAGSEIHDPYKD